MNNKRIKLCFGALFFGFFLLFLKLTFLQIVLKVKLKEKALRQNTKVVEVHPQRGVILDRNGKKLAVSVQVSSVYAIPNKLRKGNIPKIAEILNINRKNIEKALNTNKKFIWLKRKIMPDEEKTLRLFNFSGIGFIKENMRYYPNQELACHILGFSGIDGNGLEGIEFYHDKLIAGTSRAFLIKYDGLKRPVFRDTYSKQSENRVVLTIDKFIQYITERELKYVCKKYNAKSASAIVLNCNTGEILSMANEPSFNPNKFSKFSRDKWRNRAITDCFEPGSTFKVFISAAGLEEDIVKENDIFFCENGRYEIHNSTIHDHEKYGRLKFSDIIAYSSNIGMIKVANKIGADVLYDYLKTFGFGKKTRIDMPGEAKGSLKELPWSKSSMCYIPIGHEISVTAIQLASAFSSVVNGGNFIRPYVVKYVYSSSGDLLYFHKKKTAKRVISSKTSRRIIKILKKVVEYGTGVSAKTKLCSVAGKTGTAQKFDTKLNRYSDEKYTASFIGCFPTDKPRFVILVVVNEPKKNYWGGSIAAPIFKNITEEIIRYLDINEFENVGRQTKSQKNSWKHKYRNF